MSHTYPALVDVHNKSDKSEDFSISMHFATMNDRLDAIQNKIDLCQRVEAVPSISSMYTLLS